MATTMNNDLSGGKGATLVMPPGSLGRGSDDASRDARSNVEAPVEAIPASSPVAQNPVGTEPSAPKKKGRAKFVFLGLAGAALLGTTITFVLGRGKETTDDAFVEGHVASVQARVSGLVKRVAVKDNQAVKPGDILLELDDADYKVKLASAKADLHAAEAQLLVSEKQLGVVGKSVDSNLMVAKGGLAQAGAQDTSTRAMVDQARADVSAAESRKTLATGDLSRADKLFAQQAISKAEHDERKNSFDQAEAALAQARARLASAQANIGGSQGNYESARGRLVAAESGPAQLESAKAQVELSRARVDQAKAAVDQAELNLSYTQVKAEVAGVVSRRSVETGQLVSPDRPLLAIVALDDTWIVANYKEDQVREMHTGQTVKIKVDTYSGRELTGHVDSLSAGTGSRFSLLPPDNASGNFTKVVQRVPVLIRVDDKGDAILRPGLSAVVTVVTKEH